MDSISTSNIYYISSILAIAEMFIFMPIYSKTEMTRKRTNYQTIKAHFFILPLMAIIFTPRIINLALFFGVWRGLGCFFTFFGTVTIYTIIFATLIFASVPATLFVSLSLAYCLFLCVSVLIIHTLYALLFPPLEDETFGV